MCREKQFLIPGYTITSLRSIETTLRFSLLLCELIKLYLLGANLDVPLDAFRGLISEEVFLFKVSKDGWI